MKIIGITGGVGAGKSRILKYMQDHWGAYVCSADEVGHALQKQGERCYEGIVDYFGMEILNEAKEINRDKLAEIVFSDQEKREALARTMHPFIRRKICDYIGQEKKKKTKYFILEGALLIEADYATICDELWYIYATEDVRRERLKEARGYTDEKISEIFAAQLSQEEYQAQCKYVIDNNGIFEETCRQIEALENRQDEIM